MTLKDNRTLQKIFRDGRGSPQPILKEAGKFLASETERDAIRVSETDDLSD